MGGVDGSSGAVVGARSDVELARYHDIDNPDGKRGGDSSLHGCAAEAGWVW